MKSRRTKNHTPAHREYLRQTMIERNTKHGYAKRSEERGREYRTWKAIRERCFNPNAVNYDIYGGRGIKMCERWDNFERFLRDVGTAPSLKHSIDRYPDVNGNYEPGNVRWATRLEQANNTRTNVKVTIDGIARTISEWSRISHINPSRIARRIRDGWDGKDAVFLPPKVGRNQFG